MHWKGGHFEVTDNGKHSNNKDSKIQDTLEHKLVHLLTLSVLGHNLKVLWTPDDKQPLSRDKTTPKSLSSEQQEQHLPLIYVKYCDHVYYRSCQPDSLSPVIREVIGWLTRETKAAIYLNHDRSVNPRSDESSQETGFIILKSDILERTTIRY
jgi:hypothetical protein